MSGVVVTVVVVGIIIIVIVLVSVWLEDIFESSWSSEPDLSLALLRLLLPRTTAKHRNNQYHNYTGDQPFSLIDIRGGGCDFGGGPEGTPWRIM